MSSEPIKKTGIWCHNDLNAIQEAPTSGQITPNTEVGKFIIDLVKRENLSTILDIGTWTGNGSTLCFLTALKDKIYDRFISIECNEDKYKLALTNLKDLIKPDRDQLLWGSVLRSIPLERVMAVFPSLSMNSEFCRWHSVDIQNIERSPYLIDKLPEKLDLVLFDGGEFTTYFEFEVLFPRCTKYILLDDCNVDKCMKIRQQLQAHPEWKEIAYIPERNGFSAFMRVGYSYY